MISDRDVMRALGNVGQAFFGRFHSLREVQREACFPILQGLNVLVSSATASGKTEAIFAPMIKRIHSNTSCTEQRICVLAVAPTRALVNDLYARIERPLSDVGFTCGRQTSDHREKHKNPAVLITTPESFDSMLVRGTESGQAILFGHILGGVEAVFIDEAHLFEASPRGDQLAWLLARLRRLKAYAQMKQLSEDADLQICAASATVPYRQRLSNRLFGADGKVIHVEGTREMEIFGDGLSANRIDFNQLHGIDDIYNLVPIASEDPDQRYLVELVWAVIRKGEKDGNRKILVFVPSRQLCDYLSLALSDFIKKRRDMFVGAHHGSLDRALREDTERRFMSTRDGVLVATTTLEVGIDIGDVDVVGLYGVPPHTAALLQRIGRSGRRNGYVRVLPIARNEIEARVFASMLRAAFQGVLEPNPNAKLWSVFVQQALSHTAQAGKRGRRRKDLLQLAQDVWYETGGPVTASIILDFMIDESFLVDNGGRLYLGPLWSDRFERLGGGLHNNFDSGDGGIPVIDANTGEILTRIASSPMKSTVALAGRRLDVVSDTEDIVVKSSRSEGASDTFSYNARPAPITMSFALHARRGFGFEENEAPILDFGNKRLWFHFGGSAYQTALTSLFSGLRAVSALNGLAVTGPEPLADLIELTASPEALLEILSRSADRLSSSFSLGRYHNSLPEEIRKRVTIEAFGPEMFISWLKSRKIELLDQSDGRYRKLVRAIKID